MRERTAWPSVLAVALLLCWVEPAPCAAQPARRRRRRRRATASDRRHQRCAGAVSRCPRAAVGGVLRHRALRETERPRPARRRRRPRLRQSPGTSQGVRDLPPALPARSLAAGPRARRRRAGRRRPPSPLATTPTLKAAPFEPTDLRFPINLATALRLSDARPLIVAAAQARVWVAEAELTQAKVLWVPELNFGFDYIRHDGGGPDFNKGIMTAPSVNFFYGGAGLYGVISTTDAILPAPGGPPGPERPALGHPVGEERRPAPDRRRLLHGAPVPRDLRRHPLHRRAGPRRWSSGSPP